MKITGYTADKGQDHRVYDVGYKVFLTDLALELGIERFSIFNSLAKGELTVLLDCREDLVNEFVRRVEAERGAGSIAYEPYEGGVPPIDRYILFFQVEQLDRALSIMTEALRRYDAWTEKQDRSLQELKGR